MVLRTLVRVAGAVAVGTTPVGAAAAAAVEFGSPSPRTVERKQLKTLVILPNWASLPSPMP